MTDQSLLVQGAVSAPYSIQIGKDLSGLSSHLRALELPARRACVVTDSHVGPLYAAEAAAAAEEAGLKTHVYTWEAGEEHKMLERIRGLYVSLIEHDLDRKDILIALGGGVTGDMCGFAAATYLRGIDFVQVPTTLLSMVDSSVGGKTGVDLDGYKNMVGAFHQPRLVCIAVDTLKTLPPEQFASGMGEVIKHGLIRDAAYVERLERSAADVIGGDPETLAEIIYRSVEIKAGIVERDPLERNERRLLNFGHTIGHAIEKECGFTLTHGQCAALGSIAACRISADRGLIAEEDVDRVKRLFASYGLKTSVSGREIIVSGSTAENDVIVPERILDAVRHDKKKMGEVVPFVLLNGIGNAFICLDVSADEILRGIDEILG